MQDLNTFLELAKTKSASDLHLVSGQAPRLRIEGTLEPITETPLSEEDLEVMIKTLLSDEYLARFQKEGEVDASYECSAGRFRLNVHRQEGSIGIALRRIPETIPTPDELRLEPGARKAIELLDGLVLVVGPSGQGKSTTIASLIDAINQVRKCHIVTIEDPVEFVFADHMALIEQREIGQDTPSFSAALKHVLRQDPDVIFIGEMRDPETIATALTAAETGHLVFSTLHTGSASEAVERIIDVFDGSKQKQIQIQLSTVLRLVIAQQLLPGTNGQLVAAREILVNTPAVSNLIRENNPAQIVSSIQTSAEAGMQTMEQSVASLLEEKRITEEVAQRRSGRHREV